MKIFICIYFKFWYFNFKQKKSRILERKSNKNKRPKIEDDKYKIKQIDSLSIRIIESIKEKLQSYLLIIEYSDFFEL